MSSMKHVKFPAVAKVTDRDFLAAIKAEFPTQCATGKWTVQEHVSGIPYAFFVDRYQAGSWVKAAKKDDFIQKGEKYYEHEKIFDTYSLGACLAASLRKQDLIIFGALIGGKYGDKSEGTVYRRGPQYNAKNDFIAFDIATVEGGTTLSPKLKFLNRDSFVQLCRAANMAYVHDLYEGTLEDCLDFNNKFETSISDNYGLPEIKGNYCTGVVIKPVEPLELKSGKRVVLLNKNDHYTKQHNFKKGKKNKQLPHLSVAALELVNDVRKCLTTNRVYGVLAKHGSTIPFGQVMRHTLRSALEEVGIETYQALKKEERHAVNKTINKYVAETVRNSLYGQGHRKVG